MTLQRWSVDTALGGSVAAGADGFLAVFYDVHETIGTPTPSVIAAMRLTADGTPVRDLRESKPADDFTPVGQPASRYANPQVAWDGERWFVIAQRPVGGGVYTMRGYALDPTDLHALELPVDIVTGFVNRPFLVAVAPGRFLAGYEILDASSRRLASRFIDFNG